MLLIKALVICVGLIRNQKKKVSEGGRKMRRKMGSDWEAVLLVQPSGLSVSIYKLTAGGRASSRCGA